MKQQRPPHGNDLRKGRFSESGRIYALTAVTQERRKIFRDWTLGRLLVAEMRNVCDAEIADSLAWVIMPDHVHWLMRLNYGTLPDLMRRVKSRSAIAINRAKDWEGRVWQKGFYDHALRREEDVREIARYVVANPLRAGLVERLGDYTLWDACWL